MSTTVVYIGNFRPEHSTENHVKQALERIGCTVHPLQEDALASFGTGGAYREGWRDVADIARGVGADFVLWTHTHDYASGDRLEGECFGMIDDLRAAGIPSVSYHLDRWWGLEREHQARTEPFFRTDLVVTADGCPQALWYDAGINHVWMPPGVSAVECARGSARRGDMKDVGFVGSWQHYGHAEVWPWRFQVVNGTRLRYGARMRIWPRGGQAVRGAELRDVYASLRVVLGDSCLAGGWSHYWSDRVPETLGRGGFLVHPDVDGLDDWFSCELPWRFPVGDLGAVWHTIDRALGLSDAERLRLTDEAMQHVREAHTYDVRMRDLIALVENGAARG